MLKSLVRVLPGITAARATITMPPKRAAANTAKRSSKSKQLIKKDTEILDEQTNESPEPATKAKKPKLKKVPSQGVERQPVTRAAIPTDKPSINILSWNVNGLRAVVKNRPDELQQLTKVYKPDLLFLQETKLQDGHVADFTNLVPGYTAFFSCSTAKKGYSGTAVLIRGEHGALAKPIPPKLSKGKGSKSSTPSAKTNQSSIMDAFKKSSSGAAPAPSTVTPVKDSTMDVTDEGVIQSAPLVVKAVEYGIGKSEHDQEGRSITVELADMFVVGLYVPNSGQTLQRLDYRISEWNPDLTSYLKKLEATKPVVVVGDLNVAHLDLDIYNFDAKHIKKSSGCTPQERDAFTQFLEQGFVDSFRHRHAEAKGAFTYWSTRKNNRPESKGLRLDYCVVSQAMVDSSCAMQLLDSYQLPDVLGSDHCPVGIVVVKSE